LWGRENRRLRGLILAATETTLKKKQMEGDGSLPNERARR
jgi:hypothetical protein